MKNDQNTIDNRQSSILDMLHKNQEMKVDVLASALNVSLITVRRDLQYLENKGLVTRFHGGARINPVSDFSEEIQMDQARTAISRYAASLVEEGDSLFINGSLTASGILQYLQSKKASIVTNNAFAAGYNRSESIEITLTGGRLWHHIMVGDFCMRNLLNVYQKKAFLGCSGISPTGEILCDIPSELAINETMISHAETYYILADHTKLGKTESSGRFSLLRPGTVITDDQAQQEIVQELESRGMKVILVSTGAVHTDRPSQDPANIQPGPLSSETGTHTTE